MMPDMLEGDTPAAKAKTAIRDAASSGPLRVLVILIFASQMVIGNLLPILGERNGSDIAWTFADRLGYVLAASATISIASLLLLSIPRRIFQACACFGYAVYSFVVAWVTLPVDPYGAMLTMLYGVFGTYMAAASLPAKGGKS